MQSTSSKLWMAYKLRLKRRWLLWRALRKRHQLSVVRNRTRQITRDAILGFSTVRNEILRLPFFLKHYRALGVEHFLIVDNNSDDGTREYLAEQPDVSVWGSTHSYKKSRFGVDWLTWLQIRHGHGHWCLSVDADEILVYPDNETRPLRALTGWLDARSIPSFGALMLDMYPKGRLDRQIYRSGQNPFEILCWFDHDDYISKMQDRTYYLSVQGGVRGRVFFPNEPSHAPHLNKIPLVKWNRRFAYVSSTHAILPRRLNKVFGQSAQNPPTGVLLHSKFLHVVIDKSREEKQRQEHFTYSSRYDHYYDGLMANPDMWCEASLHYEGWQQLAELGLMSQGDWRP
ncbi:MAG: glycosyltransferase family 2 protein [Alphaproteobacteria bacterium]|nr:glycosyltransferase family 2 protein [Alphaproteobacteria bacterium]